MIVQIDKKDALCFFTRWYELINIFIINALSFEYYVDINARLEVMIISIFILSWINKYNFFYIMGFFINAIAITSLREHVYIFNVLVLFAVYGNLITFRDGYEYKISNGGVGDLFEDILDDDRDSSLNLFLDFLVLNEGDTEFFWEFWF